MIPQNLNDKLIRELYKIYKTLYGAEVKNPSAKECQQGRQIMETNLQGNSKGPLKYFYVWGVLIAFDYLTKNPGVMKNLKISDELQNVIEEYVKDAKKSGKRSE